MPAARPLRWGLLGTARINRSLIPALRASSRSELAAVASRDAARADAYAREWGIPRTFSSYEAMLADGDIDVVYNSLPNGFHAEWTIRAARAGKHVSARCRWPSRWTRWTPSRRRRGRREWSWPRA